MDGPRFLQSDCASIRFFFVTIECRFFLMVFTGLTLPLGFRRYLKMKFKTHCTFCVMTFVLRFREPVWRYRKIENSTFQILYVHLRVSHRNLNSTECVCFHLFSIFSYINNVSADCISILMKIPILTLGTLNIDFWRCTLYLFQLCITFLGIYNISIHSIWIQQRACFVDRNSIIVLLYNPKLASKLEISYKNHCVRGWLPLS